MAKKRGNLGYREMRISIIILIIIILGIIFWVGWNFLDSLKISKGLVSRHTEVEVIKK